MNIGTAKPDVATRLKFPHHLVDVIDPTQVNEELGGEEGHARLCAALGEAGLGQVLDVVPNHMAITERRNVWWWDVLENGPSSRYAFYFDVDWDPPQARLRNTVLLPILGDHYGRVLENSELKLVRRGQDGGGRLQPVAGERPCDLALVGGRGGIVPHPDDRQVGEDPARSAQPAGRVGDLAPDLGGNGSTVEQLRCGQRRLSGPARGRQRPRPRG